MVERQRIENALSATRPGIRNRKWSQTTSRVRTLTLSPPPSGYHSGAPSQGQFAHAHSGEEDTLSQNGLL